MLDLSGEDVLSRDELGVGDLTTTERCHLRLLERKKKSRDRRQDHDSTALMTSHTPRCR
jgi:hypothetical protein